MKRFTIIGMVLLIMATLVPCVAAEPLEMVPPTLTILGNGDTLQTSMFVESTNPSVITNVYEIITADPYKKWTLTVQVLPDNDSDGVPELVTSYIPALLPDPLDVNRNGVVDGYDFWAVFMGMFRLP